MRMLLFFALILSACVRHPVQTGLSQKVIGAERAALDSPTQSEIWGQLGIAYLQSGDRDSAYSALQEALRMDPDSQLAAEGLARIMSSGWVSAIERRALAAPGDDEVWGDVGDHFFEMGQIERSLPYFVRALTLAPSDSEWQQKVADAGGTDQILAIFEAQAVGQQDNDEWLGDYGDVLRQSNRIDAACAQFRNALALDPADSEWVDKVAQCDAGGMKPVAAGEESHLHEEPPTDEDPVIQIAGLEAMLEHDPENDELLGRLGELLAIEGEVDRAKFLVGRAMAIDPTDVEWPRIMGTISGRPRLEILEELVLLHPELDELHGDIGDLLVDLGRVEEARQAYEKASALDPEDKEWRKKIKLLAL